MVRHYILISASILVAGLLMHREIASALLSRGDDILRRGHPIAALRYYRRALIFQPRLDDGLDRITLIALLTHDRTSMELALHLTRSVDRLFPSDETAAFDRGLIAMRMNAAAEARVAFEQAGALNGNWQSYAFASLLARHSGESAIAQHDWRLVTRLNPAFARFHNAKFAQ